jgi:hypothetical protein
VLHPDKYDVRGTVYGAGKSYQVFYGAGLSPAKWIPISEPATTSIIDGKLAEWDASNLENGEYALKLTTTSGTNTTDFLAPAIYIDHHLKPGWPVHLPIDADFPPADWRNVRVADLNGDGNKEIVVVDPSTRTREQNLLVYSAKGELLWSRTLGFDIPPDVPAIGDMDHDGKLEVFVDTTNGVAAFRADGTPLGNGWPVQSQTRNRAKVLADLDGDGQLELITFSQEYSATQVPDMRELAAYNSQGGLVRSWQLPWCGFTNDVQKIFPAVTNIDDEPGLEIVAVSGCNEIAAFDYRRAEPKWRAALEGTVLSSPVIGDVDGDGTLDIVVATAAESGASAGGIYVINGKGQRWPGWPVLEEYSFTTAPALADLDKDGRLEIILPSTKPTGLHVVQWDGFEADGWPKAVFELATPRVGATVADVDGDGFSDVVIGAPGYMAFAITLRDNRAVGGITAWDFAGNLIPFNGTNVIPNLPFEAHSTYQWNKASPAVLTDLDGDGILDIVISSMQERTFGSLSRLKNRSGIYAWQVPEAHSPATVEWPMFGHDIANAGAYSLPMVPIVVPTNVTRAIRDRLITAEDRPLIIEPLKNDWAANGSPLSLVSFTQPKNGTVHDEGLVKLVYSPGTNFSGMDQFSYTIRDQDGFQSTADIFVRVKPVNDPPVASNFDLTMQKNTSLAIYYAANDPEKAAVTFRVIDGPQHGELWNYPSVGSYVPAAGYFGSDSFTYVANDGTQDSAPATVRITILNSNNPPVAVSQDLLTKTNRSVFVSPMGSDPDGDPLTYELVNVPESGTVVPENDGFRFTPARDFIGSVSFSLRPFDGTTYGTEAAINIAVIATNAPPRANDSSITVQPNSTVAIKLSGVDPDGDKIQFDISTAPLHGTLSGTPPAVTYTPGTNYAGPDRFTFTVADGFDVSAPATVIIQISRQNRPPESENQTVTTFQGVPLAVPLLGDDPDGDSLESVILKGPANGLLYGRGTNLIYSPFAGTVGADSFTYKLWDGERFGNPAQVLVQITPPKEDQAPSFISVQESEGAVSLVLSIPNTKPFYIQSSTNLLDWMQVSDALRSTTDTYTFRDTNAPAAFRFYRAVR